MSKAKETIKESIDGIMNELKGINDKIDEMFEVKDKKDVKIDSVYEDKDIEILETEEEKDK